MSHIEWLQPVFELYEELPTKDQIQIQEKLSLLEHFPDIYPFRSSGRFRGHRSFVAGHRDRVLQARR